MQSSLPTARTTACGRWLPATVAGSAVEGNVDRTGASVHFSEPISVMLDEWGRLLVLHTIDNGSVRVVEASLSPPQHLCGAACHEPSDDSSRGLQQAASRYEDDRRDIRGGQAALPGASLCSGGAEPLLSRSLQVGQGMHEEGSRAVGQDIVFKDVSAGAFRTLLQF